MSVDKCKGTMVNDTIFDGSLWPHFACENFTYAAFCDASMAVAAFYVKHREELAGMHFENNVEDVSKLGISKSLFYLERVDRNAPMVLEALEHIAMCYMTNTFLLLDTMVVQKFDRSALGYRDDSQSADHFYQPSYPSVNRQEGKQAAVSLGSFDSTEARKKIKTAVECDNKRRRLAVRAAKKMSKIAGKRAGGRGPPSDRFAFMRAQQSAKATTKDKDSDDDITVLGVDAEETLKTKTEEEEDDLGFQALSQDSFQARLENVDAVVRGGRQVKCLCLYCFQMYDYILTSPFRSGRQEV